MRFLLALALLALSASAARNWRGGGFQWQNNNLRRFSGKIVQVDTPMDLAETLVRNLVRNIDTKDSEGLGGYIDDEFSFIGCTRMALKSYVLDVLKKLPAGLEYKFTILDAQIDEDQLIYELMIEGFKIDFNATFVAEKQEGEYKLISGKATACP